MEDNCLHPTALNLIGQQCKRQSLRCLAGSPEARDVVLQGLHQAAGPIFQRQEIHRPCGNRAFCDEGCEAELQIPGEEHPLPELPAGEMFCQVLQTTIMTEFRAEIGVTSSKWICVYPCAFGWAGGQTFPCIVNET